MLRYINTDIVFQEFPDEVTLAINISGCPCRCPGCHSQFLWADRGDELTAEALSALIHVAKYVQERHDGLKVGWYTGRTAISPLINQQHFNYIKVGPYLRHLGGLDSPHTNQRMYRRCIDGSFEDITSRFWKHQTEGCL